MSEHGSYDEIKESGKGIPVGYIVFFVAAVVWLIWYVVTYTPQISGWSQYRVLDDEMKMAALQSATNQDTGATKGNPYKNDPKAIAEGRALFDSNCAACHGGNLKGGVGPDLTAEKTLYGDSDDNLFASVAKGRPKGMPPFDSQFGSDRIWKVVSLVESIRKRG